MAQYEGKKTKTLETFTSIYEDFPVYNLDRYISTGDNNWFRKDYTGKETKIDKELLKPVEKFITEQYYKASADRSFEIQIQNFTKIDALRTKYVCVLDLIDIMSKGFPSDRASQEIRLKFVKLMQGWGFHMNEIASPMEDLLRLQEINEQLPGIRTQIKIIEEKIKIKGQVAAQSLRKQLKIVQLALGAKSEYDPKTLIVGDWLEDIALMNEMAKQN